jgi:hypothetical protein
MLGSTSNRTKFDHRRFIKVFVEGAEILRLAGNGRLKDVYVVEVSNWWCDSFGGF